MALKVNGAGFGRTGTQSMKAALETLCYNKCHHMYEVMSDNTQVNLWHDIASGNRPDWDAIFAIGKAAPAWTKLIPRARKTGEMVNGIIWEQFFQGKLEDRAFAEKLFHDHIAEVKANIPEDRLLVMEVKEGWEPLFAFLGLNIPDEPFPHVNETADFQKRIRFLRRLAYVPWITAGVIGLSAYLLLS